MVVAVSDSAVRSGLDASGLVRVLVVMIPAVMVASS
jgi:hypothetical protein